MENMGRKKKYGEQTTIISLRVPKTKAKEIKERFGEILATEYLKIDEK